MNPLSGHQYMYSPVIIRIEGAAFPVEQVDGGVGDRHRGIKTVGLLGYSVIAKVDVVARGTTNVRLMDRTSISQYICDKWRRIYTNSAARPISRCDFQSVRAYVGTKKTFFPDEIRM